MRELGITLRDPNGRRKGRQYRGLATLLCNVRKILQYVWFPSHVFPILYVVIAWTYQYRCRGKGDGIVNHIYSRLTSIAHICRAFCRNWIRFSTSLYLRVLGPLFDGGKQQSFQATCQTSNTTTGRRGKEFHLKTSILLQLSLPGHLLLFTQGSEQNHIHD